MSVYNATAFIAVAMSFLVQWLNLASIDTYYPLNLLLAVCLGWFIKKVLYLSGQKWVATLSNTLTYVLLPAVGFVITRTISGNIALSLGMVGALSIIRFRHPVKSPLELAIYFLLLTQGIAISVSPIQAIILTLFSSLVIYVYSRYFLMSRRSTDGEFSLALNTALDSEQYIVEVHSRKPVLDLESSRSLVYASSEVSDDKYTYKLKVFSREELAKIRENLSGNTSIVRYNVLASI